MKHFPKLPLALCALLSASTAVHNNAQARMYHVWYDDVFFDHSWFDDVLEWQAQSLDRFKQHAAQFGPSKEDREAIKAARERLAKIKHTLTEDDQKVVIQFSGFESLDKKDIKIVKKGSSYIGTVNTKDGKVEFLIAQNGIQVARQVELKKEDKDKKERISFSSSLPSDLEHFSQLVALHTAKVEPAKDNTLTIVIQKQQEELLAIP